MKVVEVNVGKKIEYSVSKNKITFADELMLNCEKLERDNDECVDICIAKNGMITSGQLGEKYAAQIEIPARQYIEKEVPKYIYLYPEMVASEIYTYKSMYEEAENDLTCANFAHVDGNGENY